MASFTLSAEYHGRQVEVTWTEGMLTGDASAIGAVASMAMQLKGKPIVTPAGIIEHEHLTDPYAAYQIIAMVLGEEAQFVAGSLGE